MSTGKNLIKKTTLRMSFLMRHQEILPDLKELISDLDPAKCSDSSDYVQGAHDALLSLISALEQKGI
jgi:hypothetical protein